MHLKYIDILGHVQFNETYIHQITLTAPSPKSGYLEGTAMFSILLLKMADTQCLAPVFFE